MKEIRILHLFPKLLCLYGEYGNLTILQRTLESLGYTVQVRQWEDGALSLDDVQMVYVGSGTETAVWEANKRLLPHKDAICNAVENQTSFLVTGNAMALFGGQLVLDNETSESAGLFSYKTEMSQTKRYQADVLGKDEKGETYVGFVNTACVYRGVSEPAMKLLLNPKLGNDKAGCDEGVMHQNFFGTQLIGPVLTKNPHLLAQFIFRLTGETWWPDNDSILLKAYAIAKEELTKRLDN